jgi:hypothetical protein
LTSLAALAVWSACPHRSATSGSRERWSGPDVVDERVVSEAHTLGGDVQGEPAIVHEVDNLDALNQREMIGEQTPMTTPPH